jgi:hypothetical protein
MTIHEGGKITVEKWWDLKGNSKPTQIKTNRMV